MSVLIDMAGNEISTLEPEIESDFFQNQIDQEYEEALRNFVEDESYFWLYNNYVFHGSEVLVKIFYFKPTSDLTKKGLLGEKTIMVPVKSPLTGIIEWKDSKSSVHEKIYPLVKIIKVGLRINHVETGYGGLKEIDEKYHINEGEVYMVPPDDVMGEDWNPEFLFTMNSFVKTGKGDKPGMTYTPADMEQKIPKLKKNWDKYKFVSVDKLKDDQELIYLIPGLKLKSKYV